MPRFDKLTNGEFKRLATLGKQVQRVQAVTDEDVYWTFISEIGGGSISAAVPDEVNSALKKRDGRLLEAVEANSLHIKRWAEAGYISLLSTSDHGFVQFLLTPRGIDYLSYQAKWRIHRWLIDAWSDLRTEVVSAIVSAIISIIVSVITAYLILRLGLK